MAESALDPMTARGDSSVEEPPEGSLASRRRAIAETRARLGASLNAAQARVAHLVGAAGDVASGGPAHHAGIVDAGLQLAASGRETMRRLSGPSLPLAFAAAVVLVILRARRERDAADEGVPR